MTSKHATTVLPNGQMVFITPVAGSGFYAEVVGHRKDLGTGEYEYDVRRKDNGRLVVCIAAERIAEAG